MKESNYKSYDELPLFLNAVTVAKVLGIAPSSSYELMHEKDFPVLRIGNRNTICKHIRSLEERGLLITEPTQVTIKDGRKRNGNLRFTIRPIQFALQQDYDRQMRKLDEDAVRRKYADFIENMG